tara:strand:+ start:94 stop:924 length:831 start_codon:yes stop_codon:yes gene_type:complete
MSKKVTYTLPPDADIESFLQFVGDAEKAAKERKEAERIKKALLKKEKENKLKKELEIPEVPEYLSGQEIEKLKVSLWEKYNSTKTKIDIALSEMTEEDKSSLDIRKGKGLYLYNLSRRLIQEAEDYLVVSRDASLIDPAYKNMETINKGYKRPERFTLRGSTDHWETLPPKSVAPEYYDPSGQLYQSQLPGYDVGGEVTSEKKRMPNRFYSNPQKESVFLKGSTYYFPNLGKWYVYGGDDPTDSSGWNESPQQYNAPSLSPIKDITWYPTPWEVDE